MAWIWAADGLDDVGTGGGTLLESADGFDGIVGRCVAFCPLEKPWMVPKGSFRVAGFASSVSAAEAVGIEGFAGRDGSLGGKLGRAGGAGEGLLLATRASCALAACLALYSLPAASLAAKS
jgi:hypothetical protein